MTHRQEGETAWALVLMAIAMFAGAIIALALDKATTPTSGGEQSTQATPTSGGCATSYYVPDPDPLAEAMLARDGGQVVATMRAVWYNKDGELFLLAMNGEAAAENLWTWSVCYTTENDAEFNLIVREGEEV